MTPATPEEKEKLLRTICAKFGFNYDWLDADALLKQIELDREHAERYRDLCR